MTEKEYARWLLQNTKRQNGSMLIISYKLREEQEDLNIQENETKR